VLASRGSVIPLFHDQIKHGGPVTVTVPEMTRFLLTLEQAVDTVFAALQTAEAGEILVPAAPASTVLDIATALIGERDIEIKVTGIRPGEKMHEIMVSEEECHHTVRRGDYYAIRAMLPELAGQCDEPNALVKELSSADSVLSREGTHALLEKNHLLPGMVKLSEGGELLA